MNGVFLINKEKDWTSFDVCGRLRKRFDTRRVGHTGTLDPFAEGLLIVAIGRATKIINFLEDLDKEYIATLKLGIETCTEDYTGEVIATKEVGEYTKEEIEEVLHSFLGETKQIPPMYSALKKDGIPYYMYARDGIELKREERSIHISNIELLSFTRDTITFKASVSKGTYIRTLGVDIAKKLGTTGHLTSLTRTKIGKFDLSMAKKVNEVEINSLISISEMLKHMDNVVVNEAQERDIRNGVRLKLQGTDLIFLMNKNGDPLAIYEKRGDYYYSKKGLFE